FLGEGPQSHLQYQKKTEITHFHPGETGPERFSRIHRFHRRESQRCGRSKSHLLLSGGCLCHTGCSSDPGRSDAAGGEGLCEKSQTQRLQKSSSHHEHSHLSCP